MTDDKHPSYRSLAMESTLKALIAKVWKDEDLDLEPGSHYLDEVVTIHVSGVVT